MDYMQNNKDFLTYPPLLRNIFNRLVKNGKLGIAPFTINDLTSSNYYSEQDLTYSYSYTLKIPYAGKKLSWDIIFNPEKIDFAPDFNFNDDSFLLSQDLDMVVKNIPTLVEWNVKNSESLAMVLSEFLDLYKKQHEDKLQNENLYGSLYKQYQRLLSQDVISAEDMELFIDNNSAHFLIRVKVELSNLPAYNQPYKNNAEIKNPGEDVYIIKICVAKSDSNARSHAVLQLSPRLEQILGDTKSIHIPEFNKDSSLTVYVSKIKDLMQNRIKIIEKRYTHLKSFFTQLCNILGPQIIEFDAKTFSKATFSLEEDFSCLLQIEIDNNPNKLPSVTLHVVDCMCSNRKPCHENIDFPLNWEWSVDKMINELLNRIKTNIQDLKLREFAFGTVL